MADTRRLVLASASPRRAELLGAAGREFVVRAADVDEQPLPDETAVAHVERLAVDKACAVSADDDETVIGADTVVVLDGEIIGKPADVPAARATLRRLSGRSHEVLTGVAVRRGEAVRSQVVATTVTFRSLSPVEIDAYVATGEPMDKAGAYGIQGLGGRFVERIDGSYDNVVGLPVDELLTMLAEV